MAGTTTLKVCETFDSIQGEGVWSGYPCHFIRLAGCNLRCAYCDTSYAWEGGRQVSVAELLDGVAASGMRLVQVTGGEPLIQPGAISLLEEILARGLVCLLETNGSVSLRRVPRGVIKVVDWKTPGSGEADSFLEDNIGWLESGDQVKFVVTGRADYEWALDRLEDLRGLDGVQVLFSPCAGWLSPETLAGWMVQDRPWARLQIQLHRFLWGDRRGV